MDKSQGDKSLISTRVPDFNHPSHIHACEVRNKNRWLAKLLFPQMLDVAESAQIQKYECPLSSQLQLSKTKRH